MLEELSTFGGGAAASGVNITFQTITVASTTVSGTIVNANR